MLVGLPPKQSKEEKEAARIKNALKWEELKKVQEERRSLINNIKSERGCVNCGEKDYRCLDFHHLNPEEKLFEIGGNGGRNSPVFELLEEIEKCEIICANCHRKRHYGAKQHKRKKIIQNQNDDTI